MAIVGLGLIGGSIGLALKQHCPGVEILGVARRDETAAQAVELGAADRAGTSLALVGEADLVILACPLAATAQVLEDAIPHLAEGARVTDVGSAKQVVVAHAERVLDGERNPFIGGHPMAGKVVGGVANAEASLFGGRPWVFTPGGNAGFFSHLKGALHSERAGEKGGYEPGLGFDAVGRPDGVFDDLFTAVRAIGALPVFLPAAKHDRYVALISHIPFLLSAAFLTAVADDDAWGEAAELASSGFRDFSRLGAGDPDMYAAIASMNRDELLRAWAGLHRAMDQFEAALARHRDGDLRELLAAARATRDRWATDHPGMA